MNEERTISAVGKYTAKELSNRRLWVFVLAFAGCGLAGIGFAFAPLTAAMVFMSAGASFTGVGIAAWPWLTGGVQSRSAQRDQGGWP